MSKKLLTRLGALNANVRYSYLHSVNCVSADCSHASTLANIPLPKCQSHNHDARIIVQLYNFNCTCRSRSRNSYGTKFWPQSQFGARARRGAGRRAPRLILNRRAKAESAEDREIREIERGEQELDGLTREDHNQQQNLRFLGSLQSVLIRPPTTSTELSCLLHIFILQLWQIKCSRHPKHPAPPPPPPRFWCWTASRRIVEYLPFPVPFPCKSPRVRISNWI